MLSQSYSLRETIDTLKEHRCKLESKFGKEKLEQLIFNLEEISLDIENFSAQIIKTTIEDNSVEQLAEIFDSFQYGSIPHILGHLESIEQLIEDNIDEKKISENSALAEKII